MIQPPDFTWNCRTLDCPLGYCYAPSRSLRFCSNVRTLSRDVVEYLRTPVALQYEQFVMFGHPKSIGRFSLIDNVYSRFLQHGSNLR
jgi:hypothetical protein